MVHCWLTVKFAISSVLAVPQKLNVKLQYEPPVCQLVLRRKLETCLYKNLYTSVHGSTIHNSMKMGNNTNVQKLVSV